MRSSHKTSLILFSAIALGVFAPAPGMFSELIPVLLASMLFFTFLGIDLTLSRYVRIEPFAWVLVCLIILPFIAYLLFSGFETPILMGLIIAVSSPTAVAAPIVGDFVGARSKMLLSTVVMSNILSPITYPLVLGLFITQNMNFDTLATFQKLAMIIIMPLIVASILRKYHEVGPGFLQMGKFYSKISFIIVLWLAVSMTSARLWQYEVTSLLRIGFSSFFMACLAYGSGWIMYRGKRKMRRSMMLSLGHKNGSLAVWVALNNFGETAAIPIVFYILSHHTLNAILISRSGGD